MPVELLNLESDSLVYHLRRYCRKKHEVVESATYDEAEFRYTVMWPPVEKVLQILWRMSPVEYFTIASGRPVRERPLVVLCPEHAHILTEDYIRLDI
ncbi:MAG: hypothetical protein H6662_00245 [Ardenticatenaceae bacterium]|nr:hypothetical protein [Anaerolineales bacterium]MCB8919985.1 hypothetical protein [Ardenticatenaceae bacterium]MCB8989832.1 hypothetical protein [Ardenticatenaceae bacterium]